MYRGLNFLLFKPDNSGVSKRNPENGTAAELNETSFLADSEKTVAESYGKRLADYLDANAALYPQYKTEIDGQINPMNTPSFSGGMSLGNSISCATGGATSQAQYGYWVNLKETPSSFVHSAGKVVTVSDDEKRLVFSDLSAENSVSDITFKNSIGTWVGTPNMPMTGQLVPDLTDAINGATVGIYYTNGALDIKDDANVIVIRSTDAFVVDELCLVWFIYDAESNALHVNVQSGFTGNMPVAPGGIPNTPIDVILTEVKI